MLHRDRANMKRIWAILGGNCLLLLFYLVTCTAAYAQVRGPDEAQITVVEYSDFQCPFCARVSSTVQKLLREYPDQVKWVFKHFPLAFHPNAPLAHEAAVAAGAQGKFWEMHDLLLANQRALNRADLIQYAKQLGLDLDRFVAALDSGQYRAIVERDKAEGARLGVRGTPTFFINGRKLVGAKPISTFQAVIQKELTRLEQAPAALGRERPSFSNMAVAGPPDAPVEITVFSDFQSPLGARAVRLLKRLLGAYPDRIRLIFKNFPLAFHRKAPLAHEAALAAGEQGKFWEMHDLIFANQGRISRQDLIAYAEHLHLNMEQFMAALEQRKHQVRIKKEITEGKRLDVRGVPTFFINGKRVDGTQPFSKFKEIIDVELDGQVQRSTQGIQ